MEDNFKGASDFINAVDCEFEKVFSKAEAAAREMGLPEQCRAAAMRSISFHADDDAFEPHLSSLCDPVRAVRRVLEQKHQHFVECPDSVADVIALGLCYLILGNFPRAYVLLYQAHDVSPESDDAQLLYALGVVYAHFAKYEESQQCFERLIECGTDDDTANDVFFRMGVNARCMKLLDESLRYFERVDFGKYAPFSSDDLMFQVAFNRFLAGDKKGAKAMFRELYAKYPNSLGNVQQYVLFKYATSKNYDKVMGVVNEALARFKFDPVLCFIGALVEIKRDNIMEAYNFYTLCLNYYSDSPYFWCGFGIIYFKNHQFTDSLIAFQKAVNLKPDMLEAQLNIGLNYECLEKFDEALQAYQNGRMCCPNSNEFQVRINNLQTQKSGVRLAHSLVDIDFASQIEPIPNAYAMEYLSAVPILSPKAFEDDELSKEKLNLFATLPKSIFS